MDSSITRIRIWKSGYFAKDGIFQPSSVPYSVLKSNIGYKQANIGHVSVETSEFYASFWPLFLTFSNKIYVQKGEHSNIVKDYESEERIHDHLIDLKTLNISAMAEELKKFKESNQYWLFGPSSISSTRSASCSGLAYALLKAGGIGQLVPPSLTIRDMILATPNNLCQLVVSAKEKEDTLSREIKNENISKSFKP